MNINEFDYDLPQEFIAQTPADPRDSSKLMIVKRAKQTLNHHIFREILDYIHPEDVLVMNNTRVITARISAMRADTGGKLEILLLRKLNERQWRVLIGGKRAPAGMAIRFDAANGLRAVVDEEWQDAERIITFSEPVEAYLEQLGKMPLPPYIHEALEDNERYQTVYSQYEGSAAAPTAGLHFTPDLLLALRDKGVKLSYCTLHIGLDTFQPVRVEEIENHKIHSERAILTAENAKIINDAKLAGGRIIAVGTTSARTLETAGILSAGGDPAAPKTSENMCPWRPVIAFNADTNLFIYPGYKWRVVDAMITNFHLPKSTLLMMLSSLVGREFLLQAYEVAKEKRYRFFSFGDAMFIT
jgi:S-adenosylmethionine:tRNA ribosyltransferase-isomerase